MLSRTTRQVDDLMLRLFSASKGKLHQVLVTHYSLADSYRNFLDPSYPVSTRPIVQATNLSWRIFSKVFGLKYGLWVCAFIWIIIGLPKVIKSSLRLHEAGFSSEGSMSADIILLCTGVANESRITNWIARKHDNKEVRKFIFNENAQISFKAVMHIYKLLALHLSLCINAIQDIQYLNKQHALSKEEIQLVIPSFLVVVCRTAESVSWSYCWAKRFLGNKGIRHLYFTMNHCRENAFMHALPEAEPAYVEHGFPRRDLPPLKCRQYVYSKGYADYLRFFEKTIKVDVIGLDYFPKHTITPNRTIVIATLQDWPQYSITKVKDIFNRALDIAREEGWKLVFRTRTYDTDSFASALNGPWDEISSAADESFDECLLRTKPAMVWTTWSTAILDASAMGIESVTFVTHDLEEYFIADLSAFSRVVMPHNNEIENLRLYLNEKTMKMNKEW